MTERLTNIEQQLRDAFSPESIEVIDDSRLHTGHAGAKAGGHYTVTIVSPVFRGKGTLERHRMIYDALSNMMQTEIHALSIKALSPDEL